MISIDWIKNNTQDSFGVVIHELTHVFQRYKGGQPSWLVEGIADYIRWAWYEGRTNFPKPNKAQGYLDSYQVTAGFLLWLENRQPGTVKKIDRMMRKEAYSYGRISTVLGGDLDTLWNQYSGYVSPLP